MTVIQDAVRFMCLDLRTQSKLEASSLGASIGITIFPPTGQNQETQVCLTVMIKHLNERGGINILW